MSDKALIEAAIAVVDGWSKQRFDSRSALMCLRIDALHRAAIAAAQAEQTSATSVQELTFNAFRQANVARCDQELATARAEAAYQRGLKAAAPEVRAAPKDSNGDTDLSRCTREQLIELIRECQRALLDANEKLALRMNWYPAGKLSQRALLWYDEQQAEGGITRDAFHLFVLGLADPIR